MRSQWNRIRLLTLRSWERILSFLIDYPERCYHPSSLSPQVLVANRCEELQKFAIQFGTYSPLSPLACKVTPRAGELELIRQVLLAIYQSIRDPQICDFTTAELLAKVVAYRELEIGDWLPIPTWVDDIELYDYTVTEQIELWNNLTAFGLTSDTGPPLLLFRGTDLRFKETGTASILSDLDPEGPGFSLYTHGRGAIRKWLEAQNRPVRIIGHSLGGVLASYCALFEHDLLSHSVKQPSYSFCPPGVSSELIFKWNTLEMKPALKTFVARGDFVSKFGNLFGEVFELAVHDHLPPIVAHELLYFAEPKCYVCSVDTEKENNSPSRNYFSTLQQRTTSFAYRFGLKYLFPNPYR